MKKNKADFERVSELMNKLGKYRPKIKVQPRMLYDEVWLDVLDLAIKSKEYREETKAYTEEEQELLDLDYGTGFTAKFVRK